MEDTLTGSHATFSQVFGRQGQLMRASEWPPSHVQICVLGLTETMQRFSDFQDLHREMSEKCALGYAHTL